MSRTRPEPEQSKSEQLRKALYGLYIREKTMQDFDDYYDEKMDKLINQINNKVKEVDRILSQFGGKRGL